MAKAGYVGVGGVAKKIKAGYVGVGGVAKKIKAGYVGVGGVAKQCFSSGTPLSNLAEGTLIQITENDSPVDFYIAQHNYESGNNGSGRTLVVRKNVLDDTLTAKWDAGNVNTYDGSDADIFLNGTYKARLHSTVQSLLSTTKIRSGAGNNTTTVNTISKGIFLLSVKEVGVTPDYADTYPPVTEGSTLAIAGTLKKPNKSTWLRTPTSATNYSAFILRAAGTAYSWTVSNTSQNAGYRPCFTLPSTALCAENGGTYTLSL